MLLIAMALSFLVGAPVAVSACSCPAPGPSVDHRAVLQEDARSAAVVFTGVVRSVSSGLPFGVQCSPEASVAVTFDVDTVYKGDVAPSVSVITTGGQTCGYTFVRDRRYTVFPLSVNGRLDAGICRRHVEGSIAAGDYGLPAGRPPRN
jgi:hypothetical protein